MAGETLSGSKQELMVDTDMAVSSEEKKKKMIKYAIIIVVIIVGIWAVKKFLL